MTIAERIQLHKLGYTKEEINQLVKDNYDPTPLIDGEPVKIEPIPEEKTVKSEPIPEPKQNSESGSGNAEILKAINNLTMAIQAQNLQRAEQIPKPVETTNDILTAMLNNS